MTCDLYPGFYPLKTKIGYNRIEYTLDLYKIGSLDIFKGEESIFGAPGSWK